jgi:hypothetical protein
MPGSSNAECNVSAAKLGQTYDGGFSKGPGHESHCMWSSLLVFKSINLPLQQQDSSTAQLAQSHFLPRVEKTISPCKRLPNLPASPSGIASTILFPGRLPISKKRSLKPKTRPPNLLPSQKPSPYRLLLSALLTPATSQLQLSRPQPPSPSPERMIRRGRF